LEPNSSGFIDRQLCGDRSRLSKQIECCKKKDQGEDCKFHKRAEVAARTVYVISNSFVSILHAEGIKIKSTQTFL